MEQLAVLQEEGASAISEVIDRREVQSEEQAEVVSRAEGIIITGKVLRFGSSEPVGAIVELFAEDPKRPRDWNAASSIASSVENGFSFSVESAGRYELRVLADSLPETLRPSTCKAEPDYYSPRRADLEKTIVEIPADEHASRYPQDLQVFLKSGLTGSLYDQYGDPIVGGFVKAYSRLGANKAGYSFSGKTNELGRFELPNVTPGLVSLSFSLRRAESAEQRALMPPVVDPFDLSFGGFLDFPNLRASIGDHVVTGLVLDQYGKPFAGLSIQCQHETQGYSAFMERSVTDQDGRYYFSKLPIGNFNIRLTMDSYEVGIPVEDLKVAWWEYPLKAEIDGLEPVLTLAPATLQRPGIFTQTIHVPGDLTGDEFSADFRLEVTIQEDSSVAASLADVRERTYVRGKPPLDYHLYEWKTAPPWYNRKPQLTWGPESGGIVTIRCRLPHAPILLSISRRSSRERIRRSGSREPQLITLMPTASAPEVLLVPLPE